MPEMVEGSVARRYARALLDLGRESKSVDRFGEDLQRFLTASQQGNLIEVLSNPVYTQAERRGVLDTVLPGASLDATVVNFLRLLLDKNRFGALPDIARAYGELADLEAGRVRAVVTSASKLTKAELDRVRKALSAATGSTVVVEAVVDPSLLGGMTARVGGRVYDASLRTRLERLQLSLTTPSATPA
jgi:F-type H+-transporting ATPase subunit delta